MGYHSHEPYHKQRCCLAGAYPGFVDGGFQIYSCAEQFQRHAHLHKTLPIVVCTLHMHAYLIRVCHSGKARGC